MIEPIEWYEQQKEKYQPIIRQFERELAYYVGDDLSEFKLHLPNFKAYVYSDTFKDKLATAIKAFRFGIAKNQLASGETIDKSEQSIPEQSADDFIHIIDSILKAIETDEIRLPSVALIEILYSLANKDNNRLKRQQSLYRQIIVRLVSEPPTTRVKKEGFICDLLHILALLGDMLLILIKNEFDENDVQYPLLLALSLSHTSPRNVKAFLDKQPPQYKGDFSKVLHIALAEYSDLLLSSQTNEAYKWLNEYKPSYIETAEIIEIVAEEAEIVDISPIEETTITKVKPTINLHTATITAIYETLQPHFEPSEQVLLNTLLQGETIEKQICFRGQAATLMAFFRDLLDKEIVISGHTETARWLCFYFTANKQRKGKNQPLIEKTALNYFSDLEKKPHYLIDIRPILQKIAKKK
jgi:hypothetical protein